MALPDGTKPPERLRTAFEQFLAAVPDDRILFLVRGGEVQPRGFRVTPKSVPRLRTWLLPFFFRSAPVPETLVRLAREHAPLVRAVSTLSIEALESLLPWMERLAGKESLLGAMLLDGREDVQEAARKRLREEDVPVEPREKQAEGEETVLPVDTARKMLAKRITPLVDLAGLGFPPDTGQAPPPPAEGEPPDGGREKRRRHAVERHCRELSRRLEEKDAQTAELQNRLRRLEETGQRSVRKAEALGEELARLRREYTERVAAEVEDRLRDTAFAWLAAPREMERALAVPSETLLERAGEMLARQAEHDRHYGNLAEIQKRLEALECARRKIRRARREAVRPLPGLESIDLDLSREIERLTEVFPDSGSDASENEIFERLAAGIRRSDAAGLAEHACLLDGLKSSGALTGKQAAGLEGLLREVQKKALAESWLHEDPKNARPEDPTWQFERALRHGQRLHVLVDGHNCLFGLRARYQAGFDAPDRPGARAREALVEDLRTMVSNRPDCRIRLYFDGPERSETGILPNLRVVYSGGGDREHRADRVLLDYLGYVRQSESGPVVVVSNDADIRFKSRGRGAVPCSPAEMEVFF